MRLAEAGLTFSPPGPTVPYIKALGSALLSIVLLAGCGGGDERASENEGERQGQAARDPIVACIEGAGLANVDRSSANFWTVPGRRPAVVQVIRADSKTVVAEMAAIVNRSNGYAVRAGHYAVWDPSTPHRDDRKVVRAIAACIKQGPRIEPAPPPRSVPWTGRL